jgi:hypothetical protein
VEISEELGMTVVSFFHLFEKHKKEDNKVTHITFFEPKLRAYLKGSYDRAPLTNAAANL